MARGGSARRAAHAIGQAASDRLSQARARVAHHLGTGDPEEVVFVRSATEGLNLVAQGFGERHLRPGDEVCVSIAEHHSNLLPWRRACRRSGARLVTVPCDGRGDLDLGALQQRLGPRTRILALTHVSNVTGAVTPLDDVAELRARAAPDATLVVDGAQAAAHLDDRPATLGADFYILSGHKAYGPQGVGAVWAPRARWDETDPWLLGGGMVTAVVEDTEELAPGAARFEAGTPDVPSAVGMAAGLDFLAQHRDALDPELPELARERLASVAGLHVLGDPRRRVGVVSFHLGDIHPHDVASIADAHGVAIRAGHMCAQPLVRHFGRRAALRLSFGLHNDASDLEPLLTALREARRLLG
jgi:cysteine desulfurase/selenocysteine lyase